MYDIAKKARAGMKSKAERLAGEKDRKVDSSDWSPAPALNADVKTGMRPVSRQARKRGGKVLHKAAAEAPKQRADRMPRKAGGRVEQKGEQPLVDRYINRDLKKANEYRDGKKHEGALKRGGRAKKADGGSMSMEEMIKKNPAPVKKPLGLDKVPLPPRRPANLTTAVPNEKYKKDTDLNTQSYKKGGRIKRSDGGEAIDKRLAEYKEFQERLKKEREDYRNEMERKYPGKSFMEQFKAELKEKFSPEFFASLKADREKELSKNKEYQEFAARRAKKSDDDSDDADKKCYGGRAKKADGGSLRSQFNEAFRNARAAGDKTFEWNGKKYTTELAKPNKAPVGSMPGSSRAGAPPMGAGPGSRSANVAAPAGSGPGSSAPEQDGFFTRMFRRSQEVSGETPYREKRITVQFGPSASQKQNQADWDKPGAYKKGGRAKKNDGGGIDPRLGIVKPKALEFAQNVVTPGLKKGGRVKKEIGGAAKAAGAAATQALAPVNVSTSAPNMPPVGSGLLPQAPGDYIKPPAYDPAKYNPSPTGKLGKLLSGVRSKLAEGYKLPGMPAKKGGRIKKQIGGALSGSANAAMPQMPNLPQQAMTNARGVPFQGGQFMPPGLAKRMPQPPMATTMPIEPVSAPMPSALPTTQPVPVAPQMMNPGGQQLPAQAIANAQGQPFQLGGKFNPVARANGGRIARASGGSAKGKGKGKTNINIIIATGSKKEPQSMIPPVPQAPMGVPPMPAPNAPAAAPMGMPPMPQPPMPRKAGGRVSKVAKSFKDMTAGAGSGEGRLQKTDIAKRAPHKAGGKVYRSYKDMDAGAGSGLGRIEKTEIQSRKK